MTLQSAKIAGMMSAFYHLLRLVLCPTVWCILGNVLCTYGKDGYSAAARLNVLKMSVSLFYLKHGSIPMFPCWFSVWVMYVIADSRVLKSRTIIVLFFSPIISVSDCLTYLGVLILEVCLFKIVYLLLNNWLHCHYTYRCGKNRFTVVSTWNPEIILILVFVYYITLHTNNSKTTFAQSYI